MALAASETNVIVKEDHAVAVEKKVIVDKETGIAAEVENIAVAVDLGNGQIGVVQRQRIIGVQMSNSTSGDNTAVVHYQPQAPVTQTAVNIIENDSTEYHSNYGRVANGIAAGLTFFFITLLCIWAIPFSVIAWIFACCANLTYNDDKKICAGIFKACSLLWSLLSFIIGVAGPVAVTLGIIYRNEIRNYFNNI